MGLHTTYYNLFPWLHRAAHAMCTAQSLVYVFGGRDAFSRRNDLYQLNSSNFSCVTCSLLFLLSFFLVFSRFYRSECSVLVTWFSCVTPSLALHRNVVMDLACTAGTATQGQSLCLPCFCWGEARSFWRHRWRWPSTQWSSSLRYW